MVTSVIDVKLSFVESAKKKSEKMHTWLPIPSKYVHQISEINILVYWTNEIIRKRKFFSKCGKMGICHVGDIIRKI